MTRNAIGTGMPIEVIYGGTGSTTAPGALTNLGALPIAGGTMTGFLILNADPTTALGAVTKQYADAISAGLTVKTACVCATTANLNATQAGAGVGATLTNAGAMAAFSSDGVSPGVNDRVLVKDQTLSQHNGIYVLNPVGSGAANWVLTRATDYDQAAEIKPGNLVPITSGNLYADSSWIQTQTVTVVDTDPIVFNQFTASPNTFAVTALSNLATVAINTALLPGSDNAIDLGSAAKRFRNALVETVQTGTTAAQTTLLQAYDTLGAAYTTFATLTANNPPTMALASAVTATTQAPGDNSTKLSTTAYADAISALKADVSLDNLATVAINTALLPGADGTIDLGSASKRFRNVLPETIQTGTSNGNNFVLQGYNTGGASYTTFATITAGATPTMSLASAVTGTTQAPSDNSTRLATTAYADAQAALFAGANTSLSNLSAVAVNTHVSPGVDAVDDLGTGLLRWRNAYPLTLRSGNLAGNTILLEGYNTVATTYTTFATITSGVTSTMALDGSVTGVTQAPNDGSAKLATTQYVDTATGGGSGANVALSNLAGVAINTTLLPSSDGSVDLGSAAKRFGNLLAENIETGTTAAQTTLLRAYDTNALSYTTFATLTANNPPTMSLASAVTGTTQAASDNSTKLATTAYADAQVAAIAANKALSNLASVAVNISLLPGVDNSIDLGSATVRWRTIFPGLIETGTGAGNTTILKAYDTNALSYTTFMTLTANNPATCVLASGVTGTTQSANDNSTKLATTAYVDTSTATAANRALSNLSAVAINTSLLPASDNAIDLGDGTHRFRELYASRVAPGTTTGNTLILSGRNVGGASDTAFFTITSDTTTPTGVLASAVTGTTQAASDNSTKLATTAYADNQVSTIAANKALSNLASVAINTALLPGSDNAIDLGDGTHRFRELFAAKVAPGTTSGNTLVLSARNTGGASDTAFITLTSDTTTPTCVLASAVTATTQSANDNSTKLATTAYVDAATGGGVVYPIAVNKGGTGVATMTTAYSVVCAGTTATGALQIVAPSATALPLVSGGTSALPSYTGLTVAGGGTGVTTLTTAYGTLCAGTTATGAVQTVSPGSSGLPLVSGGASALPSYTGLGVAGGGTGVTSTTAYAVLCGGTTSTGALQSIASVGTSGQVLTSNGAGALPTFQAAAGGTNHILQYVTTTLTTTVTTATATYADVTGMSVAITPSSSSSKVIVFVSMYVSADVATANTVMVQLVRGSTAICVGAASGSHSVASGCGRVNNLNDMVPITIMYVDSPATTSATTYKMQIQPDGASCNCYTNRTSSDPNSQLGTRTASTITVMEWL